MYLTVHIPGFGQMFGVPNAVVDQYLKLATPSQLKVLLYLLRNNGQTVDHSEIAKALAISEELVEEAALFWSQTDLFAGHPHLVHGGAQPRPERFLSGRLGGSQQHGRVGSGGFFRGGAGACAGTGTHPRHRHCGGQLDGSGCDHPDR